MRLCSDRLAPIAAKLPARDDQEPNPTREAIKQISATIQTTHDPEVIAMLARCWTVMAGRMTEQETRAAFVETLVANEELANRAARPALCQAAVALAMAATPGRAKDPVGHLLILLHNDHDPDVLEILLDGIEALASTVLPDDAGFVAGRIIAVTGEQNRMNDQVVDSLMKSLDALPGDMDKLVLVELLKSPFCTDAARQTLLKMIESQTKLNFAGNPWKLVASAKEAGIDPQVFRQPARLPKDVTVTETVK